MYLNSKSNNSRHWILDSLSMELGFRIPQAKFFPDFGIQIPLHGKNVSCGLAIIVKF